MEDTTLNIDQVIAAYNEKVKIRAPISPEQVTKLIEIIKKLEQEKGSPPTWHQVRKDMHENDYDEFKNQGLHPLHH